MLQNCVLVLFFGELAEAYTKIFAENGSTHPLFSAKCRENFFETQSTTNCWTPRSLPPPPRMASRQGVVGGYQPPTRSLQRNNSMWQANEAFGLHFSFLGTYFDFHRGNFVIIKAFQHSETPDQRNVSVPNLFGRCCVVPNCTPVLQTTPSPVSPRPPSTRRC